MSEWLKGIIEEMIEAGLVEEIEPGVIQKLGGHGIKLDYTEFRLGENVDAEDIPRDEFKIILLSLMEAPELMGTPVYEEGDPQWN